MWVPGKLAWGFAMGVLEDTLRICSRCAGSLCHDRSTRRALAGRVNAANQPKPLLSKPFSQSDFLKASSSKPFLQSALLKALSFKTLRSKPLPSLQSVSPKAFSSKLLFTSICNILSKTLFADLDIPCSKQLRETRQTIRQKCLHFDGNIIGIRKFLALRQLQ